MPDEDELYDLAELFKVFGDSTRIRILFVLFGDLIYAAAGRQVDLFTTGIQNIGTLGHSGRRRVRAAGKAVVSRRVVDLDPRLDIVAECVVFYTLALVFNGVSLHEHAASDELFALEYRRDAVHDVVSARLHVVVYLTFELIHARRVHVTGTGDKVLPICVLSCGFVRDKVTAVIE